MGVHRCGLSSFLFVDDDGVPSTAIAFFTEAGKYFVLCCGFSFSFSFSFSVSLIVFADFPGSGPHG